MEGLDMAHGRGTKGKRGIGTGKNSQKTSTSKPASLKGYSMTQGNGKGGKKGAKNC